MGHSLAVVAGDGIGTEVIPQALEVLRTIGGIDFEELPWSADYYLKTGVTIPPNGYDTLRSFDAVLVGALGEGLAGSLDMGF